MTPPVSYNERSWAIDLIAHIKRCAPGSNREALSTSQPEILHSDQGSRYKSDVVTRLSKNADIRISMCGRSRCCDNILIERLWRSVKYEGVYLREYTTLPDARKRLDAYFGFYNHRRPHQKLQYRSPVAVYYELDRESSTEPPINTTSDCPLGPTCPALT